MVDDATVSMLIRLPRDLVDLVDAYRNERLDPPSRQDAIRRLLEEVLTLRASCVGRVPKQVASAAAFGLGDGASERASSGGQELRLMTARAGRECWRGCISKQAS